MPIRSQQNSFVSPSAFLISGVLCLSVCVSPASAIERWESSNAAVEKRLKDDARYLSSDELEGRGIRTKGILLASEHISQSFAKSGLNTKAVAGKPFHVFNSRTWLAPGDGNALEVTGPQGSKQTWSMGEQFTPVSLGKSGDIDMPLAFVGYGITDEKNGYDDFQGIDVKGKAVIILRREPQQDDEDSPFNGKKNSQHAYLVRKVQNAADHGAAMVLLCNDFYSITKGGKKDELMPFLVRSTLATRPVPVVHVMRDDLDKMLGGERLSQLESEIDIDLKPRSRILKDWRIRGRVAITRKGDELRNVVGVLEPDAEPEETIIVGAHYDHLGRGGSGSLAPWTRSIHNGADDNASGSTVLMEVARQVAARRSELKRRVVFIAFSAEESGLIGSARYVRSPLHPMRETAAMVNLDMVGRLGEQLTVYGTSTGVGFEAMTDRLGEKHGLKIKKIPGGSGPSDHASFHAAGVPVFHLFTGLHSDYHRPGDDFEKLNIEGMRQITRLTVDMVMELASSTKATRKPRKPRTTTPSRPAKPPAGSTTLGVSISAQPDGKGCLVTSVFSKSPAELAGIRQGDIILKIDGEATTKIEEIQTAVSSRKPKDKIKLTLQRGKVQLQVTAELAKAK